MWLLLLALTAGAVEKAHTLRTAQVKRLMVEWAPGVNALHVDFVGESDRPLGGLSFYLPEHLTLKSGKAVTAKELSGACLRACEQPLELGGPRVLRMVKEFSAELKRGGQLKFWVSGKETFNGQEWDFDVRGEARIPAE